jgi:hypothetical protein
MDCFHNLLSISARAAATRYSRVGDQGFEAVGPGRTGRHYRTGRGENHGQGLTIVNFSAVSDEHVCSLNN